MLTHGTVRGTIPGTPLDRCQRLLRRAQANPASLHFAEAVSLAECWGFRLARTRGSHHLLRHPQWPGLLNFQTRQAMDQAYKVRQLLHAIHELDQEDGPP